MQYCGGPFYRILFRALFALYVVEDVDKFINYN